MENTVKNVWHYYYHAYRTGERIRFPRSIKAMCMYAKTGCGVTERAKMAAKEKLFEIARFWDSFSLSKYDSSEVIANRLLANLSPQKIKKIKELL